LLFFLLLFGSLESLLLRLEGFFYSGLGLFTSACYQNNFLLQLIRCLGSLRVFAANVLLSLKCALFTGVFGLFLKPFELSLTFEPDALRTLSSLLVALGLTELSLGLSLDFCSFGACSCLDLSLDGLGSSLFLLLYAILVPVEPLPPALEAGLEHSIEVTLLPLTLGVHRCVKLGDTLRVAGQQGLLLSLVELLALVNLLHHLVLS